MKALQLVKNGPSATAFKTQEVAKPSPQAGEVLIKVQGFGLNFADVMARLGLYQDAPPLPSVLGYEVVGTIEAIGPAAHETAPTASGVYAHHLQVGDRVVAMTRFGGYAEYAIGNALACAKIKSDMGIAEACALATQFCTAYYAAEFKSNLNEGDHVLIHAAAGGVGTALVQLAARKKCVIIGTVGSDSKIELVKKLGATHVINYRTHDFKTEIETILGKEKIDFAFDSLGGETFKKSFQLLRPTGSIVGFGAAENAVKGNKIINGIKLLSGFGIFSPAFLLMQSRAVIGVNMLRVADHKPMLIKRALEEVVHLCESGELKPVVGGLYPASQLADAHDFLESRKSTGKIAVFFE